MADENMVARAVDPNKEQEPTENDLESKEEAKNDSDEEYKNLDTLLNQINSALDDLEMKNDMVHAELTELLKSNQEVRRQIRESTDEAPTTTE